MSEWAISFIGSGVLVGFALSDTLIEAFIDRRHGLRWLDALLNFVAGMVLMYALTDPRSNFVGAAACWVLGALAGVSLCAGIEALRLCALGRLPFGRKDD